LGERRSENDKMFTGVWQKGESQKNFGTKRSSEKKRNKIEEEKAINWVAEEKED